MTDKKPKVIEEYFKSTAENKKHTHHDEIFNPDEENIDIQTDLTDNEIRYIAVLKNNDNFLSKRNIKPVFNPFVTFLMRLKISRNRQSRKEYVDVNKHPERETDTTLAQHLGLASR